MGSPSYNSLCTHQTWFKLMYHTHKLLLTGDLWNYSRRLLKAVSWESGNPGQNSVYKACLSHHAQSDPLLDRPDGFQWLHDPRWDALSQKQPTWLRKQQSPWWKRFLYKQVFVWGDQPPHHETQSSLFRWYYHHIKKLQTFPLGTFTSPYLRALVDAAVVHIRTQNQFWRHRSTSSKCNSINPTL